MVMQAIKKRGDHAEKIGCAIGMKQSGNGYILPVLERLL